VGKECLIREHKVATELINYDTARTALQKAVKVDEVKKINDKAAALAAYAKQSKNVDMEAQCIEIRRRAERRIGELMEEMREKDELKVGGYRPKSDGASRAPSLASQGIDKHLAQRARKMARMTDSDFERGIRKIKDKISSRSEKIDKEFGKPGPTKTNKKPAPNINSVIIKIENFFESETTGDHIQCLKEIIKFKEEVDPAYLSDLSTTLSEYITVLQDCLDNLGKGKVLDLTKE
jgi:hypothetical protein